EDFDWLLCADADNLRDVRRLAPAQARGKVALLLDWAGTVPGGEVPDPYYGGEEHFEEVWSLVDAAARAAVERLSSRAGSGIIAPRPRRPSRNCPPASTGSTPTRPPSTTCAAARSCWPSSTPPRPGAPSACRSWRTGRRATRASCTCWCCRCRASIASASRSAR